MKTKYAIALSLAAMLLISPLTSCSGSKGDGTETETAAVSQQVITAGAETETGKYETDGLPENLNFGGSTVSILTVSERKTDAVSDDLLSSSLKKREAWVKDRLNAELESELSENITVARGEFAQKLKTDAASGTGAYGIIIQNRGTLGYCALQGLLADLSQLGYLDTGAPWWPGNQSEESALNGKLYVLTGDASLSATQDECCIFANAELAASAGYSDLYGLLENRSWTTEKFMVMEAGTKLPDNSDGSSKYILSYDNASLFDAVFCGAGFTLIENSEGTSRVSEKLGTEVFASFFDGYVKLLGGYTSKQMTAAAEKGFTKGQSLFHLGYVSDLETMITDPSFNVVLMPMPLLDGEQENYRTGLWTGASGFAITETCADKTAASAVLEALASYGYLKTRDAYYKTVFADSKLKSEGNLETFGLLHDTLVSDPAAIYCSDSTLRSSTRLVTDKSSVWSSIYQSNISKWSALVEGLR